MTTSIPLRTRLQVAAFSDRRVVLAALLLLAGVVMSLLSPYFLQLDNLLSMT